MTSYTQHNLTWNISKKVELEKGKKEKKKKVLDEGCPVSSMCVLGSGPRLLLGAHVLRNASRKENQD